MNAFSTWRDRLIDAIEKILNDEEVPHDYRPRVILGYALGMWLGTGGTIDGFVEAARESHRAANEALI